LTGWDLYRKGRYAMLYSLASGEPAEQVLDRDMPTWRDDYWSAYEVFEAEDGNLSIWAKGREQR
jgi:hypothetical protein